MNCIVQSVLDKIPFANRIENKNSKKENPEKFENKQLGYGFKVTV